jgi:hypothetical protein
MRSLAPIGYLLAAVTMLGAATPSVSAQLYKWVDERGVTNYSNQPPADPGTVRKLGTVEGNLSVYSPDPALIQAVAAYRQGNNRGLAERVATLERQLEAERLARQYSAAAVPAPAPCPSGVDCYGNYGSYYPAGIAGGGFFPPVGHRHKRLVQAQLPLGATAGNVVGMSGFIPGQSALSASLAPPRPARGPVAMDRALR